MIRTVLFLNPQNGASDPVVDYFERENVLERSAQIEGFLASELLVPLTGGPLLVTAAWNSPEAYQRWVENPWRAESNAALSSLLDQELQAGTKGALYRLAHGVGRTPLAQ
jgi:heme-degrading monooxygenase HmoA